MATNQNSTLSKMIVITGLLAGSLDISAAFISTFMSSGKGPVVVLHYVASGFFGTTAFTGGMAMALWGLFFHFVIAFSWTVLFFLLYPRFNFLANHRIRNGLVFGLVIWLVMNQIVLPLSNVPPGPINLSGAVRGTLILMAVVGLPISILADGYYLKK